MRRLIIAMLFSLVLAVPPASAGPKNVKLPPFKEIKLDNGLKVFIVRTSELPMVTVRLVIPAGASRDPEGLEGIADLTATMLMKGAGGLGADEISAKIENVGGRVSTGADPDMTLIHGDFMARDFDLALDVISMVVMSPDFPEDEFEREKGIAKANLIGQKENPRAVASRVFLQKLFEGHPYANPVSGYLDSVEKISRKDLEDFHGARYVPGGSVLAVVGDVDEDAAMKAVKKRFGKWKGSAAEKPGQAKVRPRLFEGGRLVVIDKPDVTQSQIRIGNIGAGRDTPDFFPLEVANTILGGGFTSRLMEEIRVNRGLSYGARSYAPKYLEGGYFMVYTYTKNQSLREAIDVAVAELDKIRDIEVGADELSGNKKYINGLFPFEIETNADLATWMTNLEFYGLGSGFVENYRSGIDAVGSADVQRVAGEYFHSRDNLIVVLTNWEETKGQLDGLGEVEVIKMDDLR